MRGSKCEIAGHQELRVALEKAMSPSQFPAPVTAQKPVTANGLSTLKSRIKMGCSPGVLAGIAFVGIFLASIGLVVVVTSNGGTKETKLKWWERTVIYHIYTPSFYDSDGDGLGDLEGRV